MTARAKWRQLVGMFRPTPELHFIEEFVASLEASLPTRDQWIAVNAEFARILGTRALLVNVGAAPKDHTGDKGRDGFQKILDNLRQIPTPAARRYSDDYGPDLRLPSNSSPSANTEDGPQTSVAHALRLAGGAGRRFCDFNYYSPGPQPPIDQYAERNMS